MIVFLFLSAVICFFIGIFYVFIIKPADYWKKRGVVGLDTWQTYKNAFDLIVLKKISFVENVTSAYDAFPDARYTGSIIFNNPQFLVRDPDLIKQITIKDFDNFINRPNQIEPDADPYLSKVLIMLRDQKWRDMRTTLSPTFTTSKMKFIYSLMSDCAQNFTKYFEKNQRETESLEMKDAFSRFSMDVIATSAFGISVNSLKNRDNEFFTYAKRTLNFGGIRAFLFFLGLMVPYTRKLFKVQVMDDEVGKFFQGIINETLRLRKKENIIRSDLIHLMLQTQIEHHGDKEGKTKKDFTNEDITCQGILFFIAGFEPISSVLSFINYELALNKDVQYKLQAEIDEAWSNSKDGQISYDALMSLKYLDMVVSEGLRKWSPALITDRLCKNDYLIESSSENEKSIIIPKGTNVVIPILALHRDPKYFPNPDVFDPERFNDENKTKIVSGSYIPFGGGPRMCLASRFALMELKVMLLHLLYKFEIDVTEKTIVPVVLDKSNPNLAAKGGIWLRFIKRSTE